MSGKINACNGSTAITHKIIEQTKIGHFDGQRTDLEFK